ncbi:LPXTG cell wall anchor domain-containing protein [Listeria monocytogenes]
MKKTPHSLVLCLTNGVQFKPGNLKVTKTQPTVAGKIKLPTTGDNLWDSVLYSVFGLIAVCVAFSLFFWRKKQKHS